MKILHEPLLHFILLGGVVFLLYFSFGDVVVPDTSKSIVVDQARMTALANQFERVWLRPPGKTEMDNLVEDYVREEILYREGVALGLDKDDLIIRRRMQQKLDFLNSDLTEIVPPTDAELKSYLELHSEKYRQPEVYSFKQIFFRTDGTSKNSYESVNNLPGTLNSSVLSDDVLQEYGDATLLPYKITDESIAGIERVFGEDFAKNISTLPVGVWSGPHVSGYGLHVVQILNKHKGKKSPLEDVRPMVERDFGAERIRKANDQFYQALRKRYNVSYIIE